MKKFRRPIFLWLNIFKNNSQQNKFVPDII